MYKQTKYCGHDAFEIVLHDENGTKYTVVCPGTDQAIMAGYALIVTDVDPPQKKVPWFKLLEKEE